MNFAISLEAIIKQNTSERFFLLLVGCKSVCSHRKCLVRKNVLRNFGKLTRKHLCQSLFLNKVSGLRPEKLSKKETLAQVFSYEFCKISKKILQNTSGQLTLSISGIFVIFSAETIDCNLNVIQLAYSVKFINFDSFQKLLHLSEKNWF